MSDYSDSGNSAPSQQEYGDEVDLDFGGVDPIQGSTPVPSGIYILEVVKAQIVGTSNGQGRMVKLESRVQERVDGGKAGTSFAGRLTFDNWFLPDRVSQTPDAYLTTRGYLRGKIEAVTGQTWDQDGMKLNVRSLPGNQYKALLVLEDRGYGLQNKVQRYLTLGEDHSQIIVPSGVSTGGASKPGNGASAPGQQAQASGRFRI